MASNVSDLKTGGTGRPWGNQVTFHTSAAATMLGTFARLPSTWLPSSVLPEKKLSGASIMSGNWDIHGPNFDDLLGQEEPAYWAHNIYYGHDSHLVDDNLPPTRRADAPGGRRADVPNPRRGMPNGAVVRGGTKAGKALKYGRAAGAAVATGGRAGSAAAAAADAAAVRAAAEAARQATVRARALTPAARPPLSPPLSPKRESRPRGRHNQPVINLKVLDSAKRAQGRAAAEVGQGQSRTTSSISTAGRGRPLCAEYPIRRHRSRQGLAKPAFCRGFYTVRDPEQAPAQALRGPEKKTWNCPSRAFQALCIRMESWCMRLSWRRMCLAELTPIAVSVLNGLTL